MADDTDVNSTNDQDRLLEQAAAQRSSGIAKPVDEPASPGDRASSSEGPDPVEGGTATGSPIAGLEIPSDVAQEAVERSEEA
jgi:hypothetical protein